MNVPALTPLLPPRQDRGPTVLHAAHAVVTGWARTVTDQHGAAQSLVGGLAVRDHRGQLSRWEGKRVTVQCHFRAAQQHVTHLLLRVRAARPSEPNGNRFTVTGLLLRLNRSEQIIQVLVSQDGPHLPVMVQVYATRAVLTTDPQVPFITLHGQVIAGVSVADTASLPYAPVPVAWKRYRPGREKRREIKQIHRMNGGP